MGKIVKYLLLGMSFSVNLREIFGSESSWVWVKFLQKKKERKKKVHLRHYKDPSYWGTYSLVMIGTEVSKLKILTH